VFWGGYAYARDFTVSQRMAINGGTFGANDSAGDCENAMASGLCEVEGVCHADIVSLQ
jgi:hypothetical protein